MTGESLAGRGRDAQNPTDAVLRLLLEKRAANPHLAGNRRMSERCQIGMAKTKIFIEPRTNGGFGAKHENGKRVVITADTQREVIAETKAKYPAAEIHVARVRDLGPGPDKFRKI